MRQRDAVQNHVHFLPDWEETEGATRLPVLRTEPLIDLTTLRLFREEVGADRFDEAFENALYGLTDRLARIEAAMGVRSLAKTERLAFDLVTISFRIGLVGVAEVATDLALCAESGDMIASAAVAARLLRLGEESLVRAAELSVEMSSRLAPA